MLPKIITPPAVEPITLEEAKLHLRVDFDDDDALISRLIKTARESAESETSRTMVATTFELALDAWPGCPSGAVGPWPIIKILNPPLLAVESITHLDHAGETQTLDPSTYIVFEGDPALITTAFRQTWPSVPRHPGAIKVRYTAGYGTDPSDVPDCVKTWMLLTIGSLYENREAVVAGVSVAPLPGLDAILDPVRWGGY